MKLEVAGHFSQSTQVFHTVNRAEFLLFEKFIPKKNFFLYASV